LQSGPYIPILQHHDGQAKTVQIHIPSPPSQSMFLPPPPPSQSMFLPPPPLSQSMFPDPVQQRPASHPISQVPSMYMQPVPSYPNGRCQHMHILQPPHMYIPSTPVASDPTVQPTVQHQTAALYPSNQFYVKKVHCHGNSNVKPNVTTGKICKNDGACFLINCQDLHLIQGAKRCMKNCNNSTCYFAHFDSNSTLLRPGSRDIAYLREFGYIQ
jgi:hypothetical protein